MAELSLNGSPRRAFVIWSAVKKLTERQTEIYSMIRSFHSQHGYPPTRQEIGQHFGFNPNAAQCHLNALSAKGYIGVAKNKSRGIQFLNA